MGHTPVADLLRAGIHLAAYLMLFTLSLQEPIKASCYALLMLLVIEHVFSIISSWWKLPRPVVRPRGEKQSETEEVIAV